MDPSGWVLPRGWWPAAVLVVLLLATGCTDEADTAGQDEPREQTDVATTDTTADAVPAGSLVDVMRDDGRLNTLVQALDAAGLVVTMQQQGPFTVFAPREAAFEALPAGRLDTLLQQDNRLRLTNLLTHHVVDGRLPASELRDNLTLTSLSGDALDVYTTGEQVRVGDATVLQTDLHASNGIIHIIDRVLVPRAER